MIKTGKLITTVELGAIGEMLTTVELGAIGEMLTTVEVIASVELVTFDSNTRNVFYSLMMRWEKIVSLCH